MSKSLNQIVKHPNYRNFKRQLIKNLLHINAWDLQDYCEELWPGFLVDIYKNEYKIPSAEFEFKEMDENGDGVISEDEWIAYGNDKNDFIELDKNKDGKITKDEFIEWSIGSDDDIEYEAEDMSSNIMEDFVSDGGIKDLVKGYESKDPSVLLELALNSGMEDYQIIRYFKDIPNFEEDLDSIY